MPWSWQDLADVCSHVLGLHAVRLQCAQTALCFILVHMFNLYMPRHHCFELSHMMPIISTCFRTLWCMVLCCKSRNKLSSSMLDEYSKAGCAARSIAYWPCSVLPMLRRHHVVFETQSSSSMHQAHKVRPWDAFRFNFGTVESYQNVLSPRQHGSESLQWHKFPIIYHSL